MVGEAVAAASFLKQIGDLANLGANNKKEAQVKVKGLMAELATVNRDYLNLISFVIEETDKKILGEAQANWLKALKRDIQRRKNQFYNEREAAYQLSKAYANRSKTYTKLHPLRPAKPFLEALAAYYAILDSTDEEAAVTGIYNGLLLLIERLEGRNKLWLDDRGTNLEEISSFCWRKRERLMEASDRVAEEQASFMTSD